MLQPPNHDRRSVTLKLEAIGDGHDARNCASSRTAKASAPFDAHLFGVPNRKPWVAEITGTDHQYGLRRQFLEYHKDYSKGNSVGTRGVYLHFLLVEGKIYEVFHFISWKNTNRYFCRIVDGKVVKMAKQEVLCAVT